MQQQPCSSREAGRLAVLIREQIGWQINDLSVLVADRGLILRGHASTAVARALAEIEAARLSGLPVVENRIEVRTRTVSARSVEC
jgi:osmotically-inducible protein OsmY